MEAFIVLFIFLFYIAIIVGLCVLFIWVCGKIAESKGLPSSYKWFGLLGVIGIIIVAVSNPTYPQYPPQNIYYQNQFPPQNGYTQNPQNNTYFGSNPYQQQSPQPQPPQQPVQPQQTQMNYCPNCGTPIDQYSVSCPNCGKMVR